MAGLDGGEGHRSCQRSSKRWSPRLVAYYGVLLQGVVPFGRQEGSPSALVGRVGGVRGGGHGEEKQPRRKSVGRSQRGRSPWQRDYRAGGRRGSNGRVLAARFDLIILACVQNSLILRPCCAPLRDERIYHVHFAPCDHRPPRRRPTWQLILSLIRELAEFEQLLHEVCRRRNAVARATLRPAPGGGGAPWASTPTRSRWGSRCFSKTSPRSLGVPAFTWKTCTCDRSSAGRGLGRALLQRVARLAVERGCGRFEWAVLDWNENAIGFYEKLGAQVMADWRICRVTGPALETLASRPAGES